jgi:hypothetical protein
VRDEPTPHFPAAARKQQITRAPGPVSAQRPPAREALAPCDILNVRPPGGYPTSFLMLLVHF